MTEKRKGGRPRKGSLYWTKSGWRARITVDVDGVPVQKSFDLETKDKAAARIKLRRLIKLNVAPEKQEAKAPLTVSEYGESWLARREGLGIAAVSYERRFFERVWKPAIGHRALVDVTKADIQQVIDDAAAGLIRPLPRREGDEPERYGQQSVEHMRATIVRLFQAAWKDELVTDNRAARTDVPDIDDGPKKARTVLTDAELEALVAEPTVDAEIKVLVMLSRAVGGLRSGDLNALDWTAFSPGFVTCTFVRRKTRKKQPEPTTLVVPEPVRAFLAVWWDRQGSPASGPVFPVRRGVRAGQAKKRSNMSYADRLRRELLKAGVDRHELHHETATTLPVDFHSTRRAYATALARVGVNEQRARRLTGHSDPKVHQRYLASLDGELPAAALPSFSTEHAETLRRTANQNHDLALFPERDTRLELATPSLGSDSQERIGQDLSGSVQDGPAAPTPKTPDLGSPCSFVMQKPPSGSARAADRALAAYLAERARELADGLI
jgi:integrase